MLLNFDPSIELPQSQCYRPPDFESAADLLSRDYQEARKKLPEKDKLYQDYLCLFEADCYLCQAKLAQGADLQKELQAKAKDLLLQIKSECDQPTLLKRISSRLQNADVSIFE